MKSMFGVLLKRCFSFGFVSTRLNTRPLVMHFVKTLKQKIMIHYNNSVTVTKNCDNILEFGGLRAVHIVK